MVHVVYCSHNFYSTYIILQYLYATSCVHTTYVYTWLCEYNLCIHLAECIQPMYTPGCVVLRDYF